jgi:putative CocE/NonD family hydrolase
MSAESTSSGTLVVERDVACPMRDGAILRADVYRPASGSHPTLITRTPYSKDHPLSVTNLMFPPVVAAERGYAVVVQDVRGRFKSDGFWEPLRCEARDGYDTVEWAARQPWSTGDVGLYGSSYMGVTTLQAVAASPPSLRTAVAYLTGGNYQDGWVYTGNALELLFNLRWAAGQALPELHRFGYSDDQLERARARLRWILDRPDDAMTFTPLEEIFEPLESAASYWREWLRHARYDEYWQSVDLTTSLSDVEIPVLNIAGWYDGFLGGQLKVHALLTGFGAGEDMDGAATGKPAHELVIGPWDHESYQGMRPNAAGDAFFGPEAVSGAAGLSERILGWFDTWLRSDAPQQPSRAPVRYFHMGPDQWREAATWPPPAPGTSLYLTSAGSANTREGDGRLVVEPAGVDSVDSYLYDPHHPVPTVGGRHLGYGYGRAGVQDQSKVELRPDVLCYTGPLLTDPLDVIGPVRLLLHVRSSAKYTDFTAKLVDVRPDSYCANVAEGIRRIGDDDGDLRGDEPVRVEIDLWDTAYRFAPGHRIRVEVSSSNFPKFDRNGNVVPVPSSSSQDHWKPAVQHVHSGPRHPSVLVLGTPAGMEL